MSRLEHALQALREDVTGRCDPGQATTTLTRVLAATNPRLLWRARISPLPSVGAATLSLATSMAMAMAVPVAIASWTLLTHHRGAKTLMPIPSVAPPNVEADAAAIPNASTIPELALADAPPAASLTPGTRRPSAAAVPRTTKAPPRDSAELAAYERAHRVHVAANDAASALAHWDRYLADFHDSPWEPEARYNRALCLVRLGRNDEAQRALSPFAHGAYGGYHEREAKALLAALSSTPPVHRDERLDQPRE